MIIGGSAHSIHINSPSKFGGKRVTQERDNEVTNPPKELAFTFVNSARVLTNSRKYNIDTYHIMHTKLVINLYKENINGLTIILWRLAFPPTASHRPCLSFYSCYVHHADDSELD